MSKKTTTEEFIARAKQIHGDKYDYANVIYRTRDDKVKIICPIHGVFWKRLATIWMVVVAQIAV